jgi:Flp pilus assembly pilin Flp
MSQLHRVTVRFLLEDDGAVVTEYGMLIVIMVLGLAGVLMAFHDRVSMWFATIGANVSSLS